MKKEKYSFSIQKRGAYQARFFDEKVPSFRRDPLLMKVSDLSVERDRRFVDKYYLGVQQLRNSTVLDIGCGTGRQSVSMAMMGCRKVYGIDLSPKSVQATALRAQINGVAPRVIPLVMSAEQQGFKDNSFDLIVGNFVLHHVNVHLAGKEIARVLKPGGYCIFYENSSKNRLLMLLRNLLPGRFGIVKRSDDVEYPLKESEIREFAAMFKNNYQVYYPDFIFFQLLSRVLFKKSAAVAKVTSKTDKTILRLIPWIRRYSYHQVIKVQKPMN